MPRCVSSMLTAPQVCLHTLELQVVGAAASLRALVAAPALRLGGAALPASLFSSGHEALYLQGRWQEGAPVLADFGVLPLLAAAFLAIGLFYGA